MRKVREFFITAVITMALIGVIAFCISGTVFSQNKGADRMEDAYYQAIEREYVREIRTLLEEKGYKNSGVTLNRVIEEAGVREYVVTIYHKRIAELGEGQQRELIRECCGIAFPAENCSFYHEFLETDS